MKYKRILYIIGVVTLLIGAIDPLEGSVVIAGGSACLALSTYLKNDRQWRIFLLLSILIVTGVFFLFYFSALGDQLFRGGGDCALFLIRWGWLMTMILLVARSLRRYKQYVNV